MNELLTNNQFFSGGLILMIVGSILALCRGVPKILWSFLVRQLTMSIEIRNDDSNFTYFENWASKQNKIKFREMVADNSSGLSPAPGLHFFFYKKRIVRLMRNRNESSTVSRYNIPEKFILQFIPCRDIKIPKEFLTEIKKTSIPDEGNIITIDLPKICLDIRKRKMDTLFLKSGQKKEIIGNIKWFLNNRNWYENRGIPWRLGILLYGPPGNGKTSLVKGIASEFNLRLKVVQLSAIDGDASLICSLITNKPEVILIEDIDSYDFAQARKIENIESKETKIELLGGITLSGLLNAIDGIAPSDGRLLFITTNCPNKIDSALLRPGRIDKKILIDNASTEQAEKMFNNFFPNSNGEGKEFAKIANGNISMADIQQVLLEKQFK